MKYQSVKICCFHQATRGKKKRKSEQPNIFTHQSALMLRFDPRNWVRPPSPCPQVSASETPQTETSVYMSAHPLVVSVESLGFELKRRGVQVTPNQMNSSEHGTIVRLLLYSHAASFHCE